MGVDSCGVSRSVGMMVVLVTVSSTSLFAIVASMRLVSASWIPARRRTVWKPVFENSTS
jgi:hypothetical protein